MYCRMLLHYFRPSLSYQLSLLKTFVLSIFEWPFYTGFTAVVMLDTHRPVGRYCLYVFKNLIILFCSQFFM